MTFTMLAEPIRRMNYEGLGGGGRYPPASTPPGTDMDKDVLGTILEVEQEIQERIVAEQREAWTMLEGLRQELDAEVEREVERLASVRRSAESAARAKAEEQAALIARRAAVEAERLAGLDDGELERCILRHLVRIMPGEQP